MNAVPNRAAIMSSEDGQREGNQGGYADGRGGESRRPKGVAVPLLHLLSLLPRKQPMLRSRINALSASFFGRQRFSKWGFATSTMAQWALFRHYDVALVWASGARLCPAAVHFCAEEMNAWIGARCVDKVVLDDVTHFGGCVWLMSGKGWC